MNIQLTIVAQIVSITVQTTNSVFFLDDGTGRIEARLWVDSSSEESVTSGEYGKYVYRAPQMFS